MGNPSTNSPTLLDPSSALEPSARLSHPSPPPPVLPPTSSAQFRGWETIGVQRSFYDEQDFLHPSQDLTNDKLQNRGEDEVVIFDFSLSQGDLSRANGNPPAEGGGSPLGCFSADDDIFFRVPKDGLIESEQFNQVISPTKESRPILSRGPRLGIIDFPQCYDTYDDNLLNLMGEKLGLQQEGETGFMNAYSQRVRALPGCERFRTGISLRAPLGEPSEFSRLGSSEDRFVLFVSFPYFGESGGEITLGPESESVRLFDFKCLGVSVPNRMVRVEERDYPSEISVREERDYIGKISVGDDIGKILVHQARYMIFDNHLMATFRSKEDSAKGQVPLHHFQQRIGAFGSMVLMISNRTKSELLALGMLQASLRTLEEDIDQIMSRGEVYEGNQGIRSRFPNFLASLNILSEGLFAAISIAERQIAVLHDLHTVFLTISRANAKDPEKGYPLQQSPFIKNVALTHILSEYPEQVWPSILSTIDEVVRERNSFIEKIKGLLKSVEARRYILSLFLGSNQTNPAPFAALPAIGGGAQLVNCVLHDNRVDNRDCRIDKSLRTDNSSRTDNSVRTQLHQTQQIQALSGLTVINTAFLCLSFFTSYFGMNNIKEFDAHPISRRDFWAITGPICFAVLLLTVIFITWEREKVKAFRKDSREKLKVFTKKKMGDIKKQWQMPSRNSTSDVTAGDSERSTEKPSGNLMDKFSFAIKRAAATVSIPKWRGQGTQEMETSNPQPLSTV